MIVFHSNFRHQRFAIRSYIRQRRFIINEILLPIARQQTNAIILADIKSAIFLKRTYLLRQIEQLQQNFITSNQQRVAELSRALSIAKYAKIDRPYINDNKNCYNVFMGKSPLFMVGVPALSKMLESMKSEILRYRFINDKSALTDVGSDGKPLVPKVGVEYNQLVYLSELHPDLSSMQPVTVREAILPTKGSPSTKMIVVVSAILGVIFGCFIALVIIALEQRRSLVPAAKKDHTSE